MRGGLRSRQLAVYSILFLCLLTAERSPAAASVRSAISRRLSQSTDIPPRGPSSLPTAVYDTNTQAWVALPSQLGQDAWVMCVHPTPGYYVDLGAHRARQISNTWALDKQGWTGLCVDPFPLDYQTENRSCTVAKVVVAGSSGLTVSFHTAQEYGGIADHLDLHRDTAASYPVTNLTTVTLLELLQQQGAPKHIEYLSIDVEGAQHVVLKAFDFTAYTFGLLTVEHNNEEPKRSFIKELLEHHGYVRCAAIEFDDWYVNATTATELSIVNEECIPPFDKVENAAGAPTSNAFAFVIKSWAYLLCGAVGFLFGSMFARLFSASKKLRPWRPCNKL